MGNATGSRSKYVSPDKKWRDYDALPPEVKARLQVAQSNWLCGPLTKNMKNGAPQASLLRTVDSWDNYHLQRSLKATRRVYGPGHPQA